MARVKTAALAVLLLVCTPAVARAHGDPASDDLLVRDVFLKAGVDAGVKAKLSRAIRAAAEDGFHIKVAIIGSRADLGTEVSLFGNAQKYAELLGLELASDYRTRVLVVMPNGFGYSIAGKRDAAGIRVVKRLAAPGGNPTKQVEAAGAAVRKLAVATASGGASQTRDRITIAAGAVALAALLAAIVLWRRA